MVLKLIEKSRDKEKTGIENFNSYMQLVADPKVADVLCIWENVSNEQGRVIDSHLVRIMPVYVNDTLEALVARYAGTFPEEVVELNRQLEIERQLAHEKGWSELKSMRLAANIPEKLYRCIEFWRPGFFRRDGLRKNLRLLSQAVPKLMVGCV